MLHWWGFSPGHRGKTAERTERDTAREGEQETEKQDNRKQEQNH